MRTTEIIEALLFASDAPLTAADLSRADEDLDEDAVEQAILALRAEYDAAGRAFQIYEIAGGYQLLTRPEYAGVLERFHTVPQSGRLSGPALEVLAIIAYRQPIGRTEIEEIRGIGSAGVLRTLQERQLIDVVGRGEGLGRPLLYGTTQKFLEHFGFNSLHDLPRPDELPVVLKQRGPADGAAAPEPDAQAQEPAGEAAPQSEPSAEEPTVQEAAATQPAPEAAEPEASAADSAGEAVPEPEASAADPVGGAAPEPEAPTAAHTEEAGAAPSPEAPASEASAAPQPEPEAPESEASAAPQPAPEAWDSEASAAPEPAPEAPEAEAPTAQPPADPAAAAELAGAATEPPAPQAVPEPAEEAPASPSAVTTPDHGSAASNGAGQGPSQVQATAVEPGASAN